MEILFQDTTQKIYMNSSKEVFVQNKKCGTTLRMQVTSSKGGISVACNDVVIKPCNYHAVNGLHFERG